MKKLITLIVVCLILGWFSLASAVQVTIIMQYSFNPPAALTVQDYGLFVDDGVAPIATIPPGENPWTGSIDLPEGEHSFSLVANYDNDTSSPSSEPYNFYIHDGKPVIIFIR